MKFKALLLLNLIWFCAWNNLPAQPGLILETSGGYTNNVFHNYKALPDYFTDLNAFVNHDWIKEKYGLRTWYSGSLTSFDRYKDKNYQNHSLGISWYKMLGENGNKLNTGVSVSKRMHSETYRWFELLTGSMYVNTKLVLNEQLYSYFGFNLTSRRYENLPAFSYWQAVLFARMSKFFSTGTTVILEGDVMNKNYFPASETDTAVDFPEVVTVGDGNSISNILLLRLAQGITPKTGISLQLQGRRNYSSTVRYLGNLDGYYYSDEEIFDDVFGYNEEKLELALTQVLPWRLKLLFENSVQWKKYNNRQALDLEGNPLQEGLMRADKRWLMAITLKKTFHFSKAMDPFAISVSWSAVNNQSNDPYYNYKGGFVYFNLSQNL